jgi:hypothetical protein
MTKSTPITQLARLCLFDWPEIAVWYFIWQVKPTCKVSKSKSIWKFFFYITCTIEIQCFYNHMTKSTPIPQLASLCLFDWFEISVWYFIWQAKFTCKVSKSKSIWKFLFYTAWTIEIQCFYNPMTKSDPNFTARTLVFVPLTWNFSRIVYLAC